MALLVVEPVALEFARTASQRDSPGLSAWAWTQMDTELGLETASKTNEGQVDNGGYRMEAIYSKSDKDKRTNFINLKFKLIFLSRINRATKLFLVFVKHRNMNSEDTMYIIISLPNILWVHFSSFITLTPKYLVKCSKLAAGVCCYLLAETTG